MDLDGPLAALAGVRADTLELVAGLDQAALDRVPGRGRWSVGEVLDHLVLVDGFYRLELERLIALALAGRTPELWRGTAEVDVAVAFVPRSLMPLVDLPLTWFSSLLPAPVRDFLMRSPSFPARHPSFAAPRHGRPAADLRRELAGAPATTRALLAAHPDLDYGAMTYRQPVLGRNSVPEMLHVLVLHERRHQDQVRAALATEARVVGRSGRPPGRASCP
jgi:hypothetical protein